MFKETKELDQILLNKRYFTEKECREIFKSYSDFLISIILFCVVRTGSFERFYQFEDLRFEFKYQAPPYLQQNLESCFCFPKDKEDLLKPVSNLT